MNKYTQNFYSAIEGGSLKSAEIVVPIIIDLLHPKSIVDVGCGTGTWISVFEKNGIVDAKGIDGPFVEKERLLFSKNNFLVKNLDEKFSIDRKFDLAISIEVAEHIKPESADNFISSLTKLSSVILFSAAIPHQGGEHHINEQWPSYWAKIFLKNGYVPVDVIRERLWMDNRVKFNYSQNMIMFVEKEFLKNNLKIKSSNPNFLDIVHPDMFLSFVDRDFIMPKKLLKSIMLVPFAIRNFLRHK